jgi:hypothetical protein
MAKTKQALLKFLVRKEVFFAKELLRRRVEVVASTQRRTVGWRYFVFKDFFKKELCFALCVDGQPIFL